MADDLRRVGLVFTQEGAVDFKKSLQDVNIEMTKNYNQFKLTQAQWDKSTTSTQKLRQEQEYLKNAYEIQTDKVNTLKMQLSDLENVENKNVTAIKKKQNELTNAEIKLESYNKKIKEIESQLKNTGKAIEEFGTKIEQGGEKIEKAGKKVSAFSIATGTALVACAKSAIDFEDAFTGVEKTVDGTEQQMTELKQGIRDMAKEIPSTTTEISAVAEAAGQLGIKTEDILSFTRVMIDLGNSTNLSAEEAASALAKFANITNMSAKDYDKLGSTIVALGNNFATTEADIVSMATRLAATGELTGLTQSQILSLATAMSSVGIEAEAGGSAMSKLLKKIQLATELGGENLEQFAKVAGMSSEDFKKAFEKDAVKALSAFISGLNDTERNGKSAIAILNNMGLTEVRLSNTILSLTNASDLLNEAVELGNEAWEDNTALANEANKRYGTLKSQITTAMNKLKDIAITLGEKLMPHILKTISYIEKFANWISKLNDSTLGFILNIGLAITALGPLLTIIGKITSVTGGAIKGIGTFVQAIGVMQGKITSTSTAVNGLASVFKVITNPIGLACGAIALAIVGITVAINNAEKNTKEAFSNMENSAIDFANGIDSAKSHLNDFNSELFVSSEEQQKLQEEMNEVQKGITSICKTASEERRGYTQKEITQLNEYFTKLRELNQRELEIQQKISDAITQQAITNAETSKSSLEEYKTQSQEWIKTAEEQKDRTIDLINKQTIEEIAALNTRYTTEEQRQSEEYQKQYNTIVEQKQAKINLANEEVAKISEVYTNGHLERSKSNDGWYAILQEYNKKIEDENQRNANTLENIQNNSLLTQYNKNSSKEQENYRHQGEIKKIWNQMYGDMSEEQQKELGVWLAQVAQTQEYGGIIDEETQKMVDFILDSYDSMSEGTKDKMGETMQGMLDEMKKKKSSLFTEASNIASKLSSILTVEPTIKGATAAVDASLGKLPRT